MNDTNNSGDKTISVDRKKTLSLKRTEQGTVRQSFSHGRSKAVVVEKKKRRISPPGEQAEVRPAAPAPAKAEAPKPREPQREKPAAKPRAGVVLRSLTDEESRARAVALAEARQREVEDAKRREEEEKRRAAEAAERAAREEERLKAEAEEAARHAAEEAERAAREEAEAKEAAKTAPVAEQPPVAGEPVPAKGGDVRKQVKDKGRDGDATSIGELKEVKRPRAVPEQPKPAKRGGDDRRRTKLTITTAFEEDSERGRSLAAMRRRREREKARARQSGPREKVMREVIIPETISIQELANRMAERSVDVIKLLMKQGQMLKINDIIDADTAQLITEELGHTVKRVADSDVEEGLFTDDDAPETKKGRPPVVTIMGHVDHGKTSLLDAIRHANVVSGEAGGITQHIGAYQVEQGGQKITFIDTPGHAAFTAMRARGAQVTDLVILVVAADDGVMPQTIEAIHHAKAAGVPMIVAINKIDKPAADPNRVRTELLQHEVVVESMGGDVLDVEVSAKAQTNLDGLLEAILLQSEVLELTANPEREADGVVVEAQLDKGRGPVATVLVQRGTLRVGDIIVIGAEWGRVRALVNDRGEQLKDAGPSMPVEILGLQGTPEAGDQFAVVENEARAREISDYRQRKRRERSQAQTARGSLQHMMTQLQTSGLKEFPLVIKGDVQGSIEAIIGALEKLGNDEVAARVLLGTVGGITESDVTLASASNAAIIGFNVRANKQAREAAERDGVEIRYYNVIYDLVDDVKAAMSGMLSPELRETMLGNAEILEVFNISKIGKVAGCRVTDGSVERGANVRLIRDNVVVHEGKLSTLKRFKDEVKSVVSGQECGMAFENYQDMRAGDVIECYRVEEIERTL
ncbi:MAG: translation initiation factor IF-2 [Hyphomicrobiales bacterium]|nr:MAG: translation initiation factor IF-2 [Hyphomicrobiales bacterium]